MMTPRRMVLVGASLAAVTAALALAAIVNLSTGKAVGVGPASVGLSYGYDLAAYEVLTQASPTPADLQRARALATRALQQSPYHNGARLKLVQIDVMEHGRLTPAGARLFAESYDLIPYDDDVAAWRIRFGLENWAQLSPGARLAMWREVQAWSTVDRRATAMQEILMSISNPDGRFAASLWLHVLKTKTSHNSAHRPQGRE